MDKSFDILSVTSPITTANFSLYQLKKSRKRAPDFSRNIRIEERGRISDCF